MKKLINTSILMLCLGMFAYGQVSITLNNFPREASFTDSVMFLPNGQNVAVPSLGVNQEWDYSGLGTATLYEFEYEDASSDADFTNAFNKRDMTLSFQGMYIYGEEYYALDANSWISLGVKTEAAAYSISSISGGANDTLAFPAYIDDFTGKRTFLEFPMTYQSAWVSEQKETLPFELTVAAASLQKAPGQRVQIQSESREVVGYGKLTIPDVAGNPSEEINVLLIESNFKLVDSFYLYGSPAPANLLTTFGLTQGMTDSAKTYFFYKPDFGDPVAVIKVNLATGKAKNVEYRPSAAKTPQATSITELNKKDNMFVYPNPVNAGQSIIMKFNEMIDMAQLSFIDIAGREVHRINMDIQSGFTSVETPSIAPGIYIMRVNDQDGTLKHQTRVFIK